MIEAARQRMREVRDTRRRPGRDDKVLTEWNALFLWALADAAAAFQRDDWKAAAVANGEFLLRELRQPNGRWNRSWHADGEPQARHHALAADHAALVMAFLRLGELTGEARWVNAAAQTADTMLDWFWDPHQGGLYTTADDAPALVVRQKDLHDNATPSANSVAAHGLLRLAALLGEPRFNNHADRILQLLASVAKKSPAAVSNAMLAIELRQRGMIELVIVGDEPGARQGGSGVVAARSGARMGRTIRFTALGAPTGWIRLLLPRPRMRTARRYARGPLRKDHRSPSTRRRPTQGVVAMR